MAAWIGIGAGALVLITVAIVTIFLLTSKGGGGGGASPADAVRDYYSRLAAHDYEGARAMFIPEIAAQITAQQLKDSTERVEGQTGSTYAAPDISNVSEQGNTASLVAAGRTQNGQTLPAITYGLQKVNGKWLIASTQ